jgi:predicted DNA-binding transcriptional regulator YafY
MPGPAAELGLGAALAAAQLKLQATLPASLRDRTERVGERFHLDPSGWNRERDAVPHLAAVAEAVWDERRIGVIYERWDGSTNETTLEPLGLVLKTDAWYLVARGADKIRTYRVARIRALTPLDEPFTRPANFHLADFWRPWSERFQASLYHGEATVRFSTRAQQLLFLLGPYVHRAASERADPPDAEGWIRTTFPIESLNHAEVDLLRFGPDAEVLGPPELRERLAAAAEALARRYRG